MEQTIALKEYTLGDILSHSWRLFKENFKLILTIGFIVYIPVNIILSFIPFERLIEIQGPLKALQTYGNFNQLLGEFIGIIAVMAVAFAIQKILSGEKVSVKEALKKSLSRWSYAIWTNIILGIFLLGLFLLLIIPGILYFIFWIFAVYAVVLHDKSGREALRYSKNLVKGKWWKVLKIYLALVILTLLFSIIATLPFFFIPEHFVLDIFSGIIVDIVWLFFAVAMAVFFINLDNLKSKEISETEEPNFSSPTS